VQQFLYTGSSAYNGGAVRFDLDWVAANWPNNGCDLWEEIQSTDFFWGRYNFRYGLDQGIQLALKMNDTDTANRWKSAKQAIENTLGAHYTGQFVYESTNRQKDTAVLLAFNHGDLNDGLFAPTSAEVAGTISTLTSLFTSMFSVNRANSPAGLTGVLMGRYQGDTYNGGNPWVLSSAALAQLYYRGASATLVADALPGEEAMVHFRKLLSLNTDVVLAPRDFALALTNQGDAVLQKIRYFTARYAFHQPEQLERDTGDLTR
jgi:glucoamylase